MSTYRAEVLVRDEWVPLPDPFSVPFEIGIDGGLEKIRPMLGEDRKKLLDDARCSALGRETRVVEHDGEPPNRYWLRHPTVGRFVIVTGTPPGRSYPGSGSP